MIFRIMPLVVRNGRKLFICALLLIELVLCSYFISFIVICKAFFVLKFTLISVLLSFIRVMGLNVLVQRHLAFKSAADV